VEDILIGVTDRTIPIFIVDPAATDGGGKTGLAHTDITVAYTRYETDNDVVHNDVTSSLNALTNLTDAHNDWGWKEVSATLSPGQYRLDVADALFASGAWYTVLQVTITTSLAAATPKAFRLVARNDLDGVRLGLTALPNAAPDAAGGLPISDAGGLDLDAKIGALTYGTANRVNAQVYGMEANVLTATAINADAITAAKVAADVTTEIQSGLATAAALATVATVVDAIKVITDALGATAAARLALSAGQIIPFTVDTTVAPSTTEFEADDITEATADHYNGRIVIFTSGVLVGQATSISDYALAGGKGHFTVAAMTEAPGNNDTGIIV
jgi:hypothetical protein